MPTLDRAKRTEPTDRVNPPIGLRAIGLTVAVLLAAGAVAGCSSGGPSKAENNREAAAAAVQVVELRLAGKAGPAYELLATQQQELLSLEDFADCAAVDQIAGADAKVTSTHGEHIRIPGTDQTSDSKRITMDVTGKADDEAVDETTALSMVDVKGTWRWTLDPDEIEACSVPKVASES